MVESTFIEPVGDLIETLSAAGKRAGKLSNTELTVEIQVTYLGLQMRASRAPGLGQHRSQTSTYLVGYLELHRVAAPLDLLDAAIDRVLNDIGYKGPRT